MSDHRAVRCRAPATRTALRAAAVALLGVLASAAVAPPASADAADAQAERDAPVNLQLTGVDAVVDAADDEIVVTAEIRHDGVDEVTDVTVELVAHEALSSRSDLQRALDAPASAVPALGSVLGTATRSGPDLPAGGRRFVSVRTTLDELGLDARASSVRPLALSVVGDTAATAGPDQLAQAATALVVAPAAVDVPVAASLLVRLLGIDPATGDGEEAIAWVPPVAEALATAAAPVSVAADPLLSRTIAGAAVTDLLAGDAARRVAVPYASADLDALLRAGLDARARSHVALGLAPWPGDPDAPVGPEPAGASELVVAPAAPLQASTAAELLAGRTPAIVVPADGAQLDPAGERVTSPGPLRPLGDVAGMSVLVGDRWLSRTLATRPQLGEADVQRVLAETALLWLERPGTPEQRGLLLDPGSAWRPSPEGLATLLGAMDDAPWLQLSGLADLLGVEASPRARLVVPAPAPPPLSQPYLEELDEAWTLVDAATGILTTTEPGAGAPSPAPDAGTRTDDVVADGVTAGLRLDLLRAASVAFRGEEREGRSLIARAEESAAALVAGVEVVSQPTITLTDQSGRLPVVLRNDSGSPLRVRVALGSRRLSFPTASREVTLAPQTTTTVVFEARARTPGGTSPVDVTVTDPSGGRALATGAMVVRIASYPVSALVVLGVVALVLLVTWLRGRLRRRRADRPPIPGAADVGERVSSATEQR